MKRIITAMAVAALAIGFAPQAGAATTFQGGPLTSLSSDAPTSIHIALSGYPTTHGLYIEQAVKTTDGSRPALHGTPLWVSAVAADLSQGATSIKGDIVLVVDNGHSWGADCAHQQCGIFMRADHNATANLLEDQFIPLTFLASTAPAPTSTAAPTPTAPAAPAIPADTLAVTANGVALVENVPGSITYRTPLTFAAKTGSGVVVTLKSYTPDLCPVNGLVVDALKGTGVCDIAVISTGDAMHAPKTAHFPLMLSPATQSLTTTTAAVKIGKSVALTSTTAFGEKITYKSSSKNCSVSGAAVKGLKDGSCPINATAPGTANYGALKASVLVTVKK